MIHQDTICALATAAGMGAIAVIRLSGPEAIAIADRFFVSVHQGKQLAKQKTHTLHYGSLKEGDRLFDEVVVSLFRGPNSYTGEDVVEISCHGSVYIQNQILQLLLRSGAHMANPGEFTFRAFMNGRMDLSQAEAVADVIASDSEKSHQLALNQMRGGFSQEIAALRDQLIKFASLIELELDFSTEDVEFADRDQLDGLMNKLKSVLRRLCDSFAIGNVIKNGIPVAIAGEPNVGKSTLLNALLNEERAIVSDIAGTTRDTIEDEMIIDGIRFRFIDTAGIRETTDTIESLGIEKTYEKIDEAKVVLFLFDVRSADPEVMAADLEKLKERLSSKQLLVVVANKIDGLALKELQERFAALGDLLFISAKRKENIQALRAQLLSFVSTGALSNNETLVSNSRHYEALNKSLEAIVKVQDALAMGLSGDLLAMDIRLALDYLGEITGEITTDDLLDSIFRDFCIGK